MPTDAYPCRKASIGFTFEPRRAGTPPARAVTPEIAWVLAAGAGA